MRAAYGDAAVQVQAACYLIVTQRLIIIQQRHHDDVQSGCSLDRAGKKSWYTDRLLADASAPVAPNRVHFLFWGRKVLDRQQARRSKNDRMIVKYDDGAEEKK